MVLAIEGESFEHAWKESDFIRCLRNRNCIGMVAEKGELVVGYMIYELHQNRLHLLNIATNKRFRGQGIATAMVDKLKGKLSQERRNRIMLEICERNLAGQVYFRGQGFKAISVLRDFYEDSTEDAYLMSYRCGVSVESLTSNRMSG